MHSSLLIWCDSHLKHLNDRRHNTQNRRSVELSSRLFETYKYDVRPHVCHIYNSDTDMDMVTIFPCPSQHHGLPHWKFALQCCDKFLIISLSPKDINKDATNTFSTIYFRV